MKTAIKKDKIGESFHSLSFGHRVLFAALFVLFTAFGASAQQYFVISYSDGGYYWSTTYYMSLNSSNTIQAVTQMDVNCLWELTGEGYLRNVATGRYVKASGTTLNTVGGTGESPTVFTNSSGYLAYTESLYSYTEYYYYNYRLRNRTKQSTDYILGINGGSITGGRITQAVAANYNNSSYNYTYSATPLNLTSLTLSPSQLDVQVRADASGDMLIALDETNGNYTTSSATYTPTNYPYYDGTNRYFYYVNNTLYYGTTLPSPVSTPAVPTVNIDGQTVNFSWQFSASLEGVSVSDGGVATVTNRPTTDRFFDITATVVGGGVSASATLNNVIVEGSRTPVPVIVQTGDTPAGGTASIYSDFMTSHIYYTVGDVANPPAAPVLYDAQHNPTLNTTLGGSATFNSATGHYEIAPYTFTTSPVVIKAVSKRGDNYSGIVTDTLYLTLPAPVLTPFITDYATNTGSLSIVSPGIAGVTVAYTTDGTDPDYTVASDGTITAAGTTQLAYCAATNCSTTVSAIPLFGAVKAISIMNGWHTSPVAGSIFSMSSGVITNSDGSQTAVLADLEDHRWSYYSGDPDPCDNTTYYAPEELRSLHPMNIKIVYKAGGVAGGSPVQLSYNEAVTEFDYYATLERNTDGTYSYTTIANPFSKRPATGSGSSKVYYGFNGWKLTNITGGTSSVAMNGTVSANGKEANITFTPTATPGVNAVAMTVEFTAQWAEARVVAGTASQLAANIASSSLSSTNSFERNFVVITGGNLTTGINQSSQKNVTISMRYPDGTAAGDGYISGDFTCNADTKFEYININDAGTYTANNYYLCLGRGITKGAGSYCVRYVRGFEQGTSNNYKNVSDPLDYTIRIESGVYQDLSVLNGTEDNRGYTWYTSTAAVNLVLGCDFDRANNDNTLLELKRYMYMSFYSFYRYNGVHNFSAVIKSGRFQTDYTDAMLANTGSNIIMADANESFYVSQGGQQYYPGYRYLELQGGEMCNIAGGIDEKNNANTLSFYFRMKGGVVRGSVYGAGAFAAASGHRKYVITGGQVRGWVAGACNGTNPNQEGGTLASNTYLYIGGNTIIGKTSGTQDTISYSRGGNVFGAGSGNTQETTGRVNNATVVVADNATVMKNVYGGGNRGYAQYEGDVYVLGGTVKGNVFGGSNMKGGTTTRVYMRSGVVEGSVYGGSNTTGTISATSETGTVVEVTGGEVQGSVFGGGRGYQTRVAGDVAVTIGKAQTTSCTTAVSQPTIGTDVYGGSEEGRVNGNYYSSSRNTTVNVHRGTIKGDVYGGGRGSSDNPAGVYGNVVVTVGDADCGSDVQTALSKGPKIRGSVFGCNNINGKPQGTVRVNINGGEMENVYGGGNNAAYGDGVGTGNQQSPHVVINAGKIRSHVFGGGLGSGATVNENTDVHVLGRTVVGKNVYGGGNGAEVKGSTHVEIGGSCDNIESQLVP